MWITINVILLVLGTGFLAYGKHIDSSENTEALMFFIFGIIFFVIGLISSLIRLALF